MTTLSEVPVYAIGEAERAGDGWRVLAACRGMDTELFYPEGRGRSLRMQEEVARQVCAECPVRRECLSAATERPERYGIWGGLTESERGWSRS